jgi:hypothetical protein
MGAKGLTMQLKIVCGGLQAVMNMNSLYLPRPFFRTGQQQGGGVSAATERNGQR